MSETTYSKENMENKAIVIGGDHHNTLGVIRGLGERNVYSYLIYVTESKLSYVNYSKYVRWSTGISEEKEIISVLLSQFKDEKNKSVIICCSDKSSSVIDENRDKLSPYFILPGADEQGRITELMSKKKMSELALSVGFNIPRTTYIKKPETELTQIQLPCIIKPLESRKGSKSEIAICRTYEDLLSYSKEHDVRNDQIQDYIDKDFEYQLIGCSTKSEVIIPGVSKILRPCKGSNTSFLHYTPLEEGFCDIEKCKEFVRKTGYHGLFSLEFLRDKNGKDYFMEINFRNDGNAICVTAAGMSLPYIWYMDCLGADYSQEKNKRIESVYVMPDMAELKLLVTRQISLKEYISDFKKTGRFMEYDKKDKRPFWKLVKYHFYQGIVFNLSRFFKS